jgi:hypothetical protein
MKNIRGEIAQYAQVGSALAIWIALIYLSTGHLTINVDALKKIPDVVFIYALLCLMFVRWMWRWRIFRGWLVPFPDLQGTWTGKLNSNWVNPETQQELQPIPCSIVIHQSFDHIAVAVHTAESSSTSIAAATNCDEANGSNTVCYMYTNRPRVSVRDRSGAHDGAAMIRLVSEKPRMLEGEYWSSRGTAGEISVTFRDNRRDDRFELDQNNR